MDIITCTWPLAFTFQILPIPPASWVGIHRSRTLCLGRQKKEWDRNIPDTLIWGPITPGHCCWRPIDDPLLLFCFFPLLLFVSLLLLLTLLMLWLPYCVWRPERACVLLATTCIPPACSWYHCCCWCNCCCPYCCWLPCSCLCPFPSY
jgi:hypothetical protein